MTDGKPTSDAMPRPYWINGINDPKDTSRLVKRVKLSDLMNYDPRASYRHKLLWEFHLGWAHKKYGWTSLASVRLIQDIIRESSLDGKAMSTRHIASGNRDLVENGLHASAQMGMNALVLDYEGLKNLATDEPSVGTELLQFEGRDGKLQAPACSAVGT